MMRFRDLFASQSHSFSCSQFSNCSRLAMGVVKFPVEGRGFGREDLKSESKRNNFLAVGQNHKLRIVAAGRGRSMCFPPIVQAVLDLVPPVPEDEKIQLVYIGTASYDKELAFEVQTHAYRKLPNFNVIKLDVSELSDNVPTESEIRTVLNSAHIILSSGGNTLYAVTRWKDLGIDKMIREIVETKNPPPVLCGGSAGGIVWFDHGHSDSMNPSTLLKVDPNLTEEQKMDWSYIR
jgi:cyanophycinase-like exopeptidase